MGISTHHLGQLLSGGYSPLLIEEGTRKPLEKGWQHYCRAPASLAALSCLLAARPGLGLGVAAGYRCMFVLDVDTDDAEISAAIGREFPLDEAPAKVGMHGASFFFRSEGPVAIKHYDGTDGARLVDLLGVGAQSVIPPSRYWPKVDDGTIRFYRWVGGRTLFDVPSYELPLIRGDVAGRMARVLAPFMPAPKPVAPIAVRTVEADLSGAERKRYAAKARAALTFYEKRLAAARKPGRGDALFKMALALGAYVHHGLLPNELLERAALDASIVNGFHKSDGAGEISATIRRALARAEGNALPALVEREYGSRG